MPDAAPTRRQPGCGQSERPKGRGKHRNPYAIAWAAAATPTFVLALPGSRTAAVEDACGKLWTMRKPVEPRAKWISVSATTAVRLESVNAKTALPRMPPRVATMIVVAVSGGLRTMSEFVSRAVSTCAAVDLCRIALARGPLVKDGPHWRYGRRRFSPWTVKQLIEEGSAVRVGNTVRSATKPPG
jgi:hypothetical protein